MSPSYPVGSMGESHRYTAKLGAHDLIIETGLLAEQAGGAVTVRMGDTMLLATATMSPVARQGVDFFPLSVDYEERLYAAGRIPGSWFRREGRPAERAILTARVTDRPLRPLFPDDMRNDVQVILTALATDNEFYIDMLCVVAASAALTISDIPWDGPVGATRVGLINGELVINPTISQMAESKLDLRLAGTSDAIIMVECGADEVDEATMAKALQLAHASIQETIAVQRQMQQALGKSKAAYKGTAANLELAAKIRERIGSRLANIVATKLDRDERQAELDDLRDVLVAEYSEAPVPEGGEVINLGHVREQFEEAYRGEVRRSILEDHVRPDGRKLNQIRPLSAQIGLIPRVHGSGLFKRGQTQVLSIVTLGTPRDIQQLDGLDPDDTKRYMHHYNFPPFSTGEASPLRGPKRREIGHGALAETALRAMIPPESEFPYTIRVVSEVLSSNGSTSMASVCGSTLSLLDAGVPLKHPVAGIAMGLIKEGDKYAILTDIQGMEDHLGDMDFKVAGTEQGITALQMDIKIKGISDAIMAEALAQAREARMAILELLHDTISEPRRALSKFAPRMHSLKIDPEKIGLLIGPGGKTVRGLQEKYSVKIDIGEEGQVYVSGSDGELADRAIEAVMGMVEDAEIGRIYTGRVTRIEPYGAFVEILPGREGMVHISQLSDHRIENINDEVAIGDELMVMVTDIDPGGKVRLSRQAVLEDWTPEEARERDGGSRGGGSRSGGDRGGGGYRGGGGDRGGGGGRSGGGGYRGGSGGGNRSGGDRGGSRF
ncbi:MAG: polyribonucleotide nucleotidyltransferase [Aggregatilineales bacterium]